jgi:hypothetical protein
VLVVGGARLRKRQTRSDPIVINRTSDGPKSTPSRLPTIFSRLELCCVGGRCRSPERTVPCSAADHHQCFHSRANIEAEEHLVGRLHSLRDKKRTAEKNVSFDCSSRFSVFVIFFLLLLLQHLTHSPSRILTITLLLCYQIVVCSVSSSLARPLAHHHHG